jgi:PadR family transcriptional regulator PadR
VPETENAVVQLRRGVLAYCVLALVTDKERYGLDLVGELLGSGLVASEGTVYPLLARLRRDGLVTTRWQESATGPPRRYYSATNQGSAAVTEFTSAWEEFSQAVNTTLRRGNHD